MKVQLVVRSYHQMIGLARYTLSLCEALESTGIQFTLAEPTYPWFVRWAHRMLQPRGLDVRTFFTTYPLSATPLDSQALTHLTAQQMATLLWFKPRLRPAVITVHDIVPFLVRNDEEQSTFRHPMDSWFDQLAMSGLKKADRLITVSEFTKKTILETLSYPSDSIRVIYEGVDHETFHPISVDEMFYDRYGLDPGLRYILYVGSENPRKNLPRLLQAFQQVHRYLPETRLIKVGARQYLPQAESLERQIAELGLEEAVLLIGQVSDGDLARFYNIAELFVFPSLMEGFGLPPLEAMACGTPVVCSHAASLPEVVGDAAIMVDPLDVDALAEAILQVLEDEALQQRLKEAGLRRAAGFTWKQMAQETLAVYQEVWHS